MGTHCQSVLREVQKYELYEMSTTASQSTVAAKTMKGTNVASKKATPKFKMSYASMITKAIQEMKQKKGSSRQAIIKHIAGTSNTVPNALFITKTLKEMIEEGTLVPGAQAGHNGAGSFKLSTQGKLRIKQAEKAANKKEMRKSAGSEAAKGVKKVAKKAVVAKKVGKKSVKKIAKKSSKASGTVEKGMKLMKKSAKKVNFKAKNTVAASKKVKK